MSFNPERSHPPKKNVTVISTVQFYNLINIKTTIGLIIVIKDSNVLGGRRERVGLGCALTHIALIRNRFLG